MKPIQPTTNHTSCGGNKPCKGRCLKCPLRRPKEGKLQQMLERERLYQSLYDRTLEIRNSTKHLID